VFPGPVLRLSRICRRFSPSGAGKTNYDPLGLQRGGMRITHSKGEHLVVLSDAEAAVLLDASTLLVVACQSVAGAALPPGMAGVLGQLLDGLSASTAGCAAEQAT
jgi:hypothetical protein